MLVLGGTAGACASPVARAGDACSAPADAGGWQQIADGLPYAGDGNWSTGLPDGRSVWVTGDAGLRSGGRRVSNTVTVVSGSCATQVPAAVPDSGDGAVYWPGPVAVVRGQVVSVGSRIRRTPGTGFGFAPVRSEIATWAVPTGARAPRLVRLTPAPASPYGVRWSAGIGTDSTTVYVWGTSDGRPGQWGVDAYVARLSARTFPLGPWSYWTGRTWSTSAAAARPVLTAAAGQGTDTAFSVSRDRFGGWRLYTRRGGAWGGEHGEYAGTLGGSWTWTRGGTEAGYLPSAHPEIPLRSGRRLVTLNVAGIGARFLEIG